jgi:hypothetical protein
VVGRELGWLSDSASDRVISLYELMRFKYQILYLLIYINAAIQNFTVFTDCAVADAKERLSRNRTRMGVIFPGLSSHVGQLSKIKSKIYRNTLCKKTSNIDNTACPHGNPAFSSKHVGSGSGILIQCATLSSVEVSWIDASKWLSSNRLLAVC